MLFKTNRKAHDRAQANADYFGRPYVCFFDTSGDYRCEPYDERLSCHNAADVTLFRPQQKDQATDAGRGGAA